MIVQCADCKTRYRLEAERVPREAIRVRCPKCAYVFGIDGSRADDAFASRGSSSSSATVARPSRGPRPSRPVTPAAGYGEVRLDSRSAPAAPSPEPVEPEWVEPVPRAEAAPSGVTYDSGTASTEDFVIERSPGPALGSQPPRASREDFGLEGEPSRSGLTSTLAPPEPQPVRASRPVAPAADPQDEKARRLARALVSDILVYNRDVRDKALADGNLVQAMGQEIKKSWELYKEKVTPEVANSSNHFREALNEILADGQQIF